MTPPDRSSESVPVHPEPVVGDPACVVWHIPEQATPLGRIIRAPGDLGRLFADGTLTQGVLARGLIWLWLADGRSWRVDGAAVRAAIQDAFADLGEWTVDDDGTAVLRRVTDYVLAGSLADYIASHGGDISVKAVEDDTVEVSMNGACAHCPAAETTLHARLETAVREYYPPLKAVKEVGVPQRSRLLLWPSPRREGRDSGG